MANKLQSVMMCCVKKHFFLSAFTFRGDFPRAPTLCCVKQHLRCRRDREPQILVRGRVRFCLPRVKTTSESEGEVLIVVLMTILLQSSCWLFSLCLFVSFFPFTSASTPCWSLTEPLLKFLFTQLAGAFSLQYSTFNCFSS